MAQQTLQIVYDTETRQLMVVGIPITSQDAKDHVMQLLLVALTSVHALHPAIIQPALDIPPGVRPRAMN